MIINYRKRGAVLALGGIDSGNNREAAPLRHLAFLIVTPARVPVEADDVFHLKLGTVHAQVSCYQADVAGPSRATTVRTSRVPSE